MVTTFNRVCVEESNPLMKTIGRNRIRARAGDHYVNATELAKAAGKKWSHYYANAGTTQFIQALVQSTGIPTDELVQMKSGNGGGTWIHPRVVIHFAQWASADFAAAVTGWVLELITTGKVELSQQAGGTLVERLLGQMERMQKQLDQLHEQRALAVHIPTHATPRATIQERLRYKDWQGTSKKQRAQIRRQANLWLDLRYEETPDVSGGPGGPCIYYGHQLVVLDEAIDAVRESYLKRERQSGPHLFTGHAA